MSLVSKTKKKELGLFSIVYLSTFFFFSFSSDFTDYILKKAREEGGSFNEHCVVGASFRGSNDKFAEVTAYFNNEGFHTPATALMMADNALYKLLAGPNASIETSNYPMPRNITETALGQLTESVTLWCFTCYDSPKL